MVNESGLGARLCADATIERVRLWCPCMNVSTSYVISALRLLFEFRLASDACFASGLAPKVCINAVCVSIFLCSGVLHSLRYTFAPRSYSVQGLCRFSVVPMHCVRSDWESRVARR